jgi:hypothetical protein
VFSTVAEQTGMDYQTAVKVSAGFGGGMMLGSVCGAVTGGTTAERGSEDIGGDVLGEAAGGISSMRTVRVFLRKGACSETLFHVLNRAYGHPMGEERASAPLAGGILMHGYQCGQIWGAALAAGAQAYRLSGAGTRAQTKAVLAAQRVIEAFRTQNGHTGCFEITELNSTSKLHFIAHFLRKGGPALCLGMAARYAPVAFREINAALAEEAVEVPAAPVSCAALLARKMGASDLYTVMAAGLAGGIGLSGGACGALGAAIWLTGINSLQESARIPFKPPKALALIDRFLECTNYEFECSSIVGRKFESLGDHACHVGQGGCSKILNALAAS